MKRKSSIRLRLTTRALRDIEEILNYSTEQWGHDVAESYLSELEAGMTRIKDRPDLLRSEPDLHSELKFYRVNKHFLVCDAKSDGIVVLTVIHASMDIPHRLAELQPTLAIEVEILHRRLHESQQTDS